MENRGLLFIPDISGFTKFVNETEIEHSRLIIQELLEILINANDIDLSISEIEGDAILFYKFGPPPELEEIYHQVEKMFCAFHRNLIAYEQRRYCQCPACMSAIKLTLKVITHYGEFTGYNVKNFNKLIGKDIIVAHQLLKNDIDQHEYWLVTKNILQDNPPKSFTNWMEWEDSFKQTESGEIPFRYTQLSKLKDALPPEPFPQLDLVNKVKVLSASRVYKTDIITLFHATGDLNYRCRWQQDVLKVEEIGHFLPRIGMRCRCTTQNGEEVIYASSYFYQEHRIEFSETEEQSKNTTYYTLEKLSDDTVKLTLDYYLQKNLLRQIKFMLLKKRKQEAMFNKSLQSLERLAKELKETGK